MIDRYHDPWVFFWIIVLYIVIHVSYGLWREDNARKYYEYRSRQKRQISETD